MKSSITIREIEKGNGRVARKNDYVHVECLFFLNRDDQVVVFPNYNDNQFVIYLKSRSLIPGLLQGIIGMHEGGERNLKISPHLAFGEKGIPGKIPPNALVICKVKLLKIVDGTFSLPNSFERSRQIVICHKGEALNKKPRWTLGILNDGEYGLTVNYPIPEMTWQHTRNKRTEGSLTKDQMETIFSELKDFPKQYPNGIVKYENVWADMSEKEGNTPREWLSNILCLHVSIDEKEKPVSAYYVTENNKLFSKLTVCKLIAELLSKDDIK